MGDPHAAALAEEREAHQRTRAERDEARRQTLVAAQVYDELLKDRNALLDELAEAKARLAEALASLGNKMGALSERLYHAEERAKTLAEALTRLSHTWSDAGPGLLARMDLIDDETKEVVKRALALVGDDG